MKELTAEKETGGDKGLVRAATTDGHITVEVLMIGYQCGFMDEEGTSRAARGKTSGGETLPCSSAGGNSVLLSQ